VKTKITKNDQGLFAVEIETIECPDLKLSTTFMIEYDFQANNFQLMLQHAYNLGKIEGMKTAFNFCKEKDL
jgi:hypothetical protein